jgi:hypothetical protein
MLSAGNEHDKKEVFGVFSHQRQNQFSSATVFIQQNHTTQCTFLPFNGRRVGQTPTFSALLTFRWWISHCFTFFSASLFSSKNFSQKILDILLAFAFNGIIFVKGFLSFPALHSFLCFFFSQLHNEHYELCFLFSNFGIWKWKQI